LKPARGMGRFADRLGSAADFARHPRIKVTELEHRLGTRFTIDTVEALCRRFPRTRFVWLMGADILRQMRHWKSWQRLFRLVPVAVFARPTYSLRGLSGLAARRFARRRVPVHEAKGLADLPPPAWVFLPIKLDARSATSIRSRRVGSRGRPRGADERER
jgi:nicotinate-nucleotide adenylyltransferase